MAGMQGKADRAAFAETLLALGVALPTREVDEPMIAVYWAALKDELTLVEFKAAASRAVKQERFFPAVATLLEYARPARAALPDQTLAVRLFDAVEGTAIHDYARGPIWTERRVREQLGDAAAEAFVAAGGASAWATLHVGNNASFVRHRFCEAFAAAIAEGVPALQAGTAARSALPPQLRQLGRGIGILPTTRA